MPVLHSSLTGSHLHFPLGHSTAGVLTLASSATAYRMTDPSSNNMILVDTTSVINAITLGNSTTDPDIVIADGRFAQNSRWHILAAGQTLGTSDSGIVHHSTASVAKGMFYDESASAWAAVEFSNGTGGTGDSVNTASGSTQTLTDSGASFSSNHVGRRLTITGCSNSVNNGTFLITGAPSGTTLEYTNSAGVSETVALTWVISGDPGHASNGIIGLYADFMAKDVMLTGSVRLGEISTPANVANTGFIYAKDAGGVTELHYEDDSGDELQMTLNGKLRAASLGVASEAQGDLLTRGASAWGRLAVGAAGAILKSNAAGTDPAYSTFKIHDASVTTGAGATENLFTKTISTNGDVVTLFVMVSGSSNDGAEAAGYASFAVFKRTGGTTSVVSDDTAVTYVAEDDAGWALVFDVSGDDARVRVTGDAANSVVWQGVVIEVLATS